MKVKQEQLAPGKIILYITVPAEKCEKFLRSKALELGEKMDIQGFRPGKAPLQIIRGQLGEMKLLTSSLEDIIQDTYDEAIIAEGLKPARQPKVDVLKVAPGNDLEYKVEVVILPEATLPELQKIKIAAKPVKITSEEEAAILKQLQQIRATEALKSGPAEIGDKVELDVLTTITKENGQTDEVKNQAVILGDTKMIDGFTENILGLTAGEEKTLQQKFPENYREKRYAGKSAEVKIKINKVWQITLPELTDDFARAVNPKFTNLKVLQDQLAENLRLEHKESENDRQELAMIDALVKGSQFTPIAEELVTARQQDLLGEYKYNIERMGGVWAKYLESIKKTEEDILKDLSVEAEQRVKIEAIIAVVVAAQKIEIADSEVAEEINKILSRVPSTEQAKKQIDLARLAASVRGRLLSREAILWLKGQIEIK